MEMMQAMLTLGQQNRAVEPGDELYLTNRVRALVGDRLPEVQVEAEASALIDVLVATAIENGKIEDTITEKEILASQLMDLVTPLPSAINHRFQKLLQEKGSRAATDDFYELCRRDNDIQTKAIAKNVEFTASGLEVTINLSKPEKDPKAIAMAATEASDAYPQCQLCLENEGYLGRVGYPARSNHRVIQIKVNGEPWGFQYSPYAYFEEHAIFIDRQHRSMVINRQTFANLMELIDQFPDYFVGSNADLPIVGGSMLSHEHYQGGRHVFPMMLAPVVQKVDLSNFPTVKAGVVDWQMTAIRLQSADPEALVDAADLIRRQWQDYSDEALDLRAETNGVRHHTVTPIAYRQGSEFVLDIVLRDNQTSDAYPDGIFHPHQDVQHIKKENIGLIEVMGRAIFPSRLIPEMEEVQKFLLGEPAEVAEYHRAWAEDLKATNSANAENVAGIVQSAVGKAFARVLQDAGVFKWDTAGRNGLNQFLATLNA
jgi:UDPglucose--hexose-1-phosphate uridylyltransferase